MKALTKALVLILALILTAGCFFPACGKKDEAPEPETDAALKEAGLEKTSVDGSEYYILPVENGSCLVRTNCDITKFQLKAAVEALGSGETVIEKFIYSDGERTYLFGSKAEADESTDDARVVLILEKDGESWKTAETVPYAMAQSLFEQLVKETAEQRSFTFAELRSGAADAKSKVKEFPGAADFYGFSGKIVSYDSGGEIIIETESTLGGRPEGQLLVSNEGIDVVYNAEESDRILASVLYMRCAEKDADCSPAVPRAVLLAYSPGFIFYSVVVNENNGGDSHTWQVNIGNPLKPFLITRDEATGEIICEFLPDITLVPLE